MTDRARKYAGRGYLTGIAIFSDAEIAARRKDFERFEQKEGKDRPQERRCGLTVRSFRPASSR